MSGRPTDWIDLTLDGVAAAALLVLSLSIGVAGVFLMCTNPGWLAAAVLVPCLVLSFAVYVLADMRFQSIGQKLRERDAE